MKQVVVFPRGQLTPKDKERLSRAGIAACEADDPSRVICLLPGSDVIQGNDILMSALKAVVNGSETRRFSEELYRRASEREAKK